MFITSFLHSNIHNSLKNSFWMGSPTHLEIFSITAGVWLQIFALNQRNILLVTPTLLASSFWVNPHFTLAIFKFVFISQSFSHYQWDLRFNYTLDISHCQWYITKYRAIVFTFPTVDGISFFKGGGVDGLTRKFEST